MVSVVLGAVLATYKRTFNDLFGKGYFGALIHSFIQVFMPVLLLLWRGCLLWTGVGYDFWSLSVDKINLPEKFHLLGASMESKNKKFKFLLGRPLIALGYASKTNKTNKMKK